MSFSSRRAMKLGLVVKALSVVSSTPLTSKSGMLSLLLSLLGEVVLGLLFASAMAVFLLISPMGTSSRSPGSMKEVEKKEFPELVEEPEELHELDEDELLEEVS